MDAPAATLPKEERLHGKKEIENLLKAGKWASEGCLRYCRAANGLEYPRIMVSVPKRLFKRAVKRNLLKRRIREAYRRNKPAGAWDILFQYAGGEVLPYAEIEAAVKSITEKLSK